MLDQTIRHINVQFGVLWLNREPAVNGNVPKSMAGTADFLPKMKKVTENLK